MMVFSVLPGSLTVGAEKELVSDVLTSDAAIEPSLFGTMPNPDYQGETVEILSELTDRREENVKHFLLSDGTVKAVAYSEPIHFKNADGSWQEIDNTLTLAEDSAALYETADQRVSFAKSAAPNDKLFTLSENGYSISMSYLSDGKTSGGKVKASVGTVENKPAKKQALTLDTIEALPKSDSGKISYANLPGNVELVYELQGSSIKESILLNAPTNQSEYVYGFRLDIGGLSAQLNANGTVSLLDKESGEEKYRIPLPYMFDAAGERSDDVFYSLIPAGKDCYLLTVTAESKWINDEERVFPVTIDPTTDPVATYDTYINSESPTSNYGASTELWISSTRTTFIKTPIPSVPLNAEINAAYLQVHFYYNNNITTGTLWAGAYQILQNWNENGVTWNSAAKYNNLGISTERLSKVEMYGTGGAYKTTPKTALFDITSAVQDWTSGSPNYGIALRYQSNGSTNTSVILHSYESDTAYRAAFFVDYEEPHVKNGVY